MRGHWQSGLDDMRHALAHPQWLAAPDPDHPFVTHECIAPMPTERLCLLGEAEMIGALRQAGASQGVSSRQVGLSAVPRDLQARR
jgi:hypothetical protein